MLRYQVTRFGEGFGARRKSTKAVALRRLRLHLRRLDGPYTINGGSQKRTRAETIEYLRKNLNDEDRRFDIAGSSYDQPRWVIRSVEVTPPTHPLIAWGSQWIGRSGYRLGAMGPPGDSDCSSFTMNAVDAKFGISIPHSAELQVTDDNIFIFHDASSLRQGDFVFTNYGRKAWPTPDHVEFWDRPGRTLGSRPSTRGVAWYPFSSYDMDRVVAFGRLKSA